MSLFLRRTSLRIVCQCTGHTGRWAVKGVPQLEWASTLKCWSASSIQVAQRWIRWILSCFPIFTKHVVKRNVLRTTCALQQLWTGQTLSFVSQRSWLARHCLIRTLLWALPILAQESGQRPKFVSLPPLPCVRVRWRFLSSLNAANAVFSCLPRWKFICEDIEKKISI